MEIKNALRKELEAMTGSVKACRPAVVRRSLKEHMLYATDIPMLLTEPEVSIWVMNAKEKGWHVERDGMWLLLDHRIHDNISGRYSGPFGEEAACCASLLKRRGGKADASRTKRRLLKAGEEGSDSYEKTCQELHEEWAVAIRNGKTLPNMALAWFEKNT